MRSFILTFIGIALIGTAVSLLVGTAVCGLPAGWGGAIGLSLTHLVDTGLNAIGEPDIAQPFRMP